MYFTSTIIHTKLTTLNTALLISNGIILIANGIIECAKEKDFSFFSCRAALKQYLVTENVIRYAHQTLTERELSSKLTNTVLKGHNNVIKPIKQLYSPATSILKIIFGLWLVFLLQMVAWGQTNANTALLLTFNGPIGPATKDYIARGIHKAENNKANIIILKLDTPGGLSSSMRSIIKAILASSVPFVTYVAPSGARAASAGMYIAYASHIAAMAPGTNIGAATPVQMGGLPFSPKEQEKQKPTGNNDKAAKEDKAKADKKSAQKSAQKPVQKPAQKQAPKTAMQKKVINDAAAYLRSLAKLRGRNIAWSQKAVFEGASISAQEALKLNVINVMADNIGDLLAKINGQQVSVLGKKVRLATKNLSLQTYAPDWRNKFLQVITNPNVAYILLIIGFYGLVFEFINPGAIVPGVVGGICFIIGLYALQMLPVNYAGLALILLGVGFMVGEAFMPSFGVLGIGGVVSFVVGSILLLDTGIPEFNIAWWVIITVSVLSAGFFLFIIGMAFRSSRRSIVSGQEEMVGKIGEVSTRIAKTGRVFVHGEDWKAFAKVPIKKGQKIVVTKVDGLELWVKPVDEEKINNNGDKE